MPALTDTYGVPAYNPSSYGDTYLRGRGQPSQPLPGYVPPPVATPQTLPIFPSVTPFFPQDPSFWLTKGNLLDALNAKLAELAYQRGIIPKQEKLSLGRLSQNQATDINRTQENAAERGIFSSGVRIQQEGLVNRDYSRSKQDVVTSATQAMHDIVMQQEQARLAYQQGLSQAAINAAGFSSQNAFLGGSIPPPSNAKGTAYSFALQAAKALGLPASWASSSALWNILAGESGTTPGTATWNKNDAWNMAQNPTSSAYGIFQFLDSTWGGYGVKKTSDPYQQFIAGLRYIKGRYGSPENAWAFWQAHHWY